LPALLTTLTPGFSVESEKNSSSKLLLTAFSHVARLVKVVIAASAADAVKPKMRSVTTSVVERTPGKNLGFHDFLEVLTLYFLPLIASLCL
jgi:hypothetical protein